MKNSDTQSNTEWLVCWMVTASFTYSIPWVHQFARLRCLICHYGQPKLKKKYCAQTTWVQCTPGVKTTLNVRCLRSKVILLTTLNADYMNLSNMWLHSMERIMCLLSCKINFYGVCRKSVERAFQFAKGMRCGDLDAAQIIHITYNSLFAKQLGDKIKIKHM